jgi:hypothetical protein
VCSVTPAFSASVIGFGLSHGLGARGSVVAADGGDGSGGFGATSGALAGAADGGGVSPHAPIHNKTRPKLARRAMPEACPSERRA